MTLNELIEFLDEQHKQLSDACKLIPVADKLDPDSIRQNKERTLEFKQECNACGNTILSIIDKICIAANAGNLYGDPSGFKAAIADSNLLNLLDRFNIKFETSFKLDPKSGAKVEVTTMMVDKIREKLKELDTIGNRPGTPRPSHGHS